MPIAALKPCAHQGCITLVHSGYCVDHRRAEVVYHPEWQRFYSTRRWKSMRARQLATQPWCEECLRANVYTPATDVDHMMPHRGNAMLFYTGKLQSLCHVCHSRKTAIEVLNQ